MLNCDLIIKGKYVLPMDKDLSIIEDGMAVVSGNKILQAGKAEDLKNQYSADETIDCGNSIVMPGLVNTHTHAAMAYFRGLADDLPLDEWWFNHIRPAEINFVKPKFIKKASELACLEMIKSGITFFNDMYYFSEVTAEVCKQVGIRAMLSDAIIDFSAPSYKNVNEAISLFKEFYNKYRDDELINVSIQPHTIYTCCRKTLIKTKELAQEFNVPVHIHVSESEKELKDCKKEHGKSPVEYLDEIGILSDKVIATHNVWLSDNDLEIYKNKGVKASHCPISNMKLASGIAPIFKMLEMGINIGLGTDGAASNNTLDLFSEMRTCALLHKVNNLDPIVMNAREVVKMATAGGAKVLGLENKIGSLESGKRADIITINLDKPHLTPIYNPFSHLVYCVEAQDVENVIINGKVIMRDRGMKTINEEKVLREAQDFQL